MVGSKKLVSIEAQDVSVMDDVQVSVLGPFAHSPEMLLGNYYGTPAGHVTTPFEAVKVKKALLLDSMLHDARCCVFVCLSVRLSVCVPPACACLSIYSLFGECNIF